MTSLSVTCGPQTDCSQCTMQHVIGVDQLDNDLLGSGYSYDSDQDIDYQPPPDIEPDLNNIPLPEPGPGPNDHDPPMNETGLNDDEVENGIVMKTITSMMVIPMIHLQIWKPMMSKRMKAQE